MDQCQWLPGKGEGDKGGERDVKPPEPAEPPKIKGRNKQPARDMIMAFARIPKP